MGLLGVFDFGAGEGKLDLARVLADIGGLALLQDAHVLHLLIGVIAVDSGARLPAPLVTTTPVNHLSLRPKHSAIPW